MGRRAACFVISSKVVRELIYTLKCAKNQFLLDNYGQEQFSDKELLLFVLGWLPLLRLALASM